MEEGEELLVSYVNPMAPREGRRRHLWERYGFWCDCPKCQEEEEKEEGKRRVGKGAKKRATGGGPRREGAV